MGRGRQKAKQTKMAAEAAKKAGSQPPKKPAVHKPFPKMPLPGKLKPGSEK